MFKPDIVNTTAGCDKNTLFSQLVAGPNLPNDSSLNGVLIHSSFCLFIYSVFDIGLSSMKSAPSPSSSTVDLYLGKVFLESLIIQQS